jgi:hypothetical protein
MPNGDIYLVEVLGWLNDIFTRNTFHFKSTYEFTTAQWLTDYFYANFFDPIRNVIAMDFTFAAVRTSLVSQPLLDSYQMELQGINGRHPAQAVDPRLAVMWSLKGDHGFSRNSTGRLFLSGVPADWAQVPPKVSEFGLSAHKTVADDLVAFFGKQGVNPYLHWGVFSKQRHRENPTDEIFYWYPITRVFQSPFLSALRSRRPRPPF